MADIGQLPAILDTLRRDNVGVSVVGIDDLPGDDEDLNATWRNPFDGDEAIRAELTNQDWLW